MNYQANKPARPGGTDAAFGTDPASNPTPDSSC